MRYLSCVFAACLLCAGSALAAALGSNFTYQGQLTNSGAPASGHYDLKFALFTVASGGTAVDTINLTNQTITGGLINAALDFTDVPYNGQALWVEVSVRVTGGASYTSLTPRQVITAAPYALYALNGVPGPMGPQGPIGTTGVTGAQGSAGPTGLQGPAGPPISLPYSGNIASSAPSFQVQNTGSGPALTAIGSGSGIAGAALNANGSGIGAVITNTSTDTVLLLGNNVSGNGGSLLTAFVPAGVFKIDGHGNIVSPSAASFGAGVQGTSSAGIGMYGLSTSGTGARGQSSSGSGVYGTTAGTSGQVGAAGVWGDTHDYYGVWGTSVGNAGVAGNSTDAAGVTGGSVNGDGVAGNGATGVHGVSGAGFGVYGHSTTGDGVHGDTVGSNASAVAGFNTSNAGGWGVFGSGADAGVFGRGADGDQGSGVLGIGSTSSVYNILAGAGVVGIAGKNSASGGYSSPGVEGYGVDINCGDFCHAYAVFGHGDFAATGAKSFVEPHPTDASKEIRYASLEGREVGTYFRGTAHLIGGRATIAIPEDFRMVTDQKGLTVQLTSIGRQANLYCITRSLDGIEVAGSFDIEFDYLVNGVRKAFVDFQPVVANSDFTPSANADSLFTRGLPAESVRRLVSNGTLNSDGSVNLETAQRLGWDKRPGLKKATAPIAPSSQ